MVTSSTASDPPTSVLLEVLDILSVVGVCVSIVFISICLLVHALSR